MEQRIGDIASERLAHKQPTEVEACVHRHHGARIRAKLERRAFEVATCELAGLHAAVRVAGATVVVANDASEFYMQPPLEYVEWQLEWPQGMQGQPRPVWLPTVLERVERSLLRDGKW